jgi:hypothetical protein
MAYRRLSAAEKAERLELCFQLLVEKAIAGERCPQSDGPHATIPKGLIPALARRGRILIEVSGHNWRQVTILEGPHAGKKTAPNPDPRATPYLRCSVNGMERHPRFVPALRGAARRRSERPYTPVTNREA